jgi:hypothetical protein
MPAIPLTTSQLIELYKKQKLTLQQIAERVGATKQAIHHRFVNAGVKLRPRSAPRVRNFDENYFRDLLINEGLSVKHAAKKVGLSIGFAWQVAHGLGISGCKYRCRKIPALNAIEVGESTIVPRSHSLSRDYFRFYRFGSKLGIKLSIETVDAATIRVTRVT